MSIPVYRKNVKASLVEGLRAVGFIMESETSFRKVTSRFIEYTVTISDKHFTLLTRERSLRDGWTEIQYPYTYAMIKSVTLRQF